MGVIESAIEKLRLASADGRSPSLAVPLAAPLASPTAAASLASPMPAQPRTAPEPTRSSARKLILNRSILGEAGYLPESGLELRFADFYREIKRPVIRRALTHNAPASQRLILVTSALPGEGKTFTTFNLALSMARERDISVLLVDGDLPKPQLSRALGVQEEPGLLDALADEAVDVESLIMPTNVKGLEFLPAGHANAAAVELVASGRMNDIALRLISRQANRLVLFDSGPLLASSEARAIVHLPGQVLLVTRAGHTPQRAVLDAIAHIDKKTLHGLVLNDAYLTNRNSYYRYTRYAETGRQDSDF